MLVTLELVGDDEPRAGRDWATQPDGTLTGRVLFGPWDSPRTFNQVRVTGADLCYFVGGPVEVPVGMLLEQGFVVKTTRHARGMTAVSTIEVSPSGDDRLIDGDEIDNFEHVPSTLRSDLPTQDEFERAGIALLGLDEPLAIRMLNASERVALPGVKR